MIRNKTIKFNLENPDERALWEWLQKQPHGTFSEVTKTFWNLSMKSGSKINQVMHDEFWEMVRKKSEGNIYENSDYDKEEEEGK